MLLVQIADGLVEELLVKRNNVQMQFRLQVQLYAKLTLPIVHSTELIAHLRLIAILMLNHLLTHAML